MTFRSLPVLLAAALGLLLHAAKSHSDDGNLASCRRGPVTVLAPAPSEVLTCPVAERAAGIHRRIGADLGLPEALEVTVVLASPQLRPEDSPVRIDSLAPWYAGLAVSEDRTIVIRVRPGTYSADHDAILAHELTHVLAGAGFPGASSWPRWFHEALAMRQSGEQGLRHRAALSLAAARGRLIPFDLLWTAFPPDQAGSRIAYAQSFSALSYLVSSHGEATFRAFLDDLRRYDFETAFEANYGYSLAVMENRWRRYVRRRYSWIPFATGGTAFWLLALALFFIALGVRRRRSRELHRQWAEEDRLNGL